MRESPRTFRALAARLLLCLFVSFCSIARADTFADDVRALTATPSRALGHAGYANALDHLRDELNQIPGIEVREQTFPVMTPITDAATLDVAGRSVPVHAFWPAGIRPVATPAAGLTGKLVYAGRCEFSELRPADLNNAIAVVEPDADTAWQRAVTFGAKAIVVLHDDATRNDQLRAFDVRLPIEVPRVYLDDAELIRSLRAVGTIESATLRIRSTWRSTPATNLFAFLGPRESKRPAITVIVPLESSSLVPSLAPGASQAVNTAAALELLRRFAASPPDRPVLFAFTGADSHNMQGVREALLALAQPPSIWLNERNDVDQQIATLEHQLERLRGIIAGGGRLSARHDADVIRRVVQLADADLSSIRDKLFRLRLARSPNSNQLEHIAELETRLRTLNAVRSMLIESPESILTGDHGDIARALIREASDRLYDETDRGLIADLHARRARIDQRVELHRWLAGKLGMPVATSTRDSRDRLIEAVIGLDLSDHGVRIGAMFQGAFARINARREVGAFVSYFSQLRNAFETGDASADWFRPLAQHFDLTTLTAPVPWTSFLPELPLSTELTSAFGVPGFALVTLDDRRPFRDTPNDRADRIDLDSIRSQLDAVTALLRESLQTQAFSADLALRFQFAGFEGQVVTAALGKPVPDLPQPGHLVTFDFTTNTLLPATLQPPVPVIGVRRREVAACDAEGRFRFEGLTNQPNDMHTLLLQSFKLEADTGDIHAASDMGKQAADIRPFVKLRDSQINPVRLIPFECESFGMVGLYDARYFQPLSDVHLLDARRNATPQRFALLAADQMMAAFVEPMGRFHLLMRYGRIGNRLILINAPAPDEPQPAGVSDSDWARDKKLGRGYSVAELRSLRAIPLATARDFARLDSARLETYRRAGVSSALIDSVHDQATSLIEHAQSQLDSSDGVSLAASAGTAWSLETLVYRAAKDMGNDVIRAAILLLLLAVPFSICMERLLIASPNIYRQIGGTLGIFAVMTAALWLFHPAFRISSSPLIIILAFAILFMSVVVITVIYQKFTGELQKIRSGRGEADSMSFARSSVLTQAVMLGIANMRKRKLRTGLTAITIVLITFAVLVFASAASYRDVTSIPTGVATSQPGVMIRQLGYRPLPPNLPGELRAMLPSTPFVERWWNVSASVPDERYFVTAGGPTRDGRRPRVQAMVAVLGVSPGESELSSLDEVIGPSHFAAIEEGREDVIFLPAPAASQLKVGVGDWVCLSGIRLVVAGIFNPGDFDRRVFGLAGDSLAPLRYELGQLDASGRLLADANAEQLAIDPEATAAEVSSAYLHLSATDIAIVPAAVSKRLPNARLAMIAARTDTGPAAADLAEAVANRLSMVIYAGTDDGVSIVSVSSLAKITGAKVAVPLLIGGLIIFNTMMGSIAERKREIAVYTSLGLAPLHVGALFVAEAMTYGVVGTVFGYIIGQGVGTAMQNLGWLGNLTLDYSGGAAMMTIGLILLVVLLSALVPARMASRLASPSIERTWSVPMPVDGKIRATLPFTINRTAADGAIAYLEEFFNAHREGNIGVFAADHVEARIVEDSGKTTRSISAIIWLTPFDLGIRQRITLDIAPGDFNDIFEVRITLELLSGDQNSWRRLNRIFLTELRKQFLRWRSLSPARMDEYVRRSRTIYRQPLQIAET